MRIRIDRQFYEFLKLMPKRDSVEASTELAKRFEEVGCAITEYPTPIIEMIYDVALIDVLNILSDYFGVREVPDKAWDLFMDCSLIGDGDCPECGGIMEWAENDYDYDEKGHKEYFSVFRCTNCGYEEKDFNND